MLQIEWTAEIIFEKLAKYISLENGPITIICSHRLSTSFNMLQLYVYTDHIQIYCTGPVHKGEQLKV